MATQGAVQAAKSLWLILLTFVAELLQAPCGSVMFSVTFIIHPATVIGAKLAAAGFGDRCEVTLVELSFDITLLCACLKMFVGTYEHVTCL